MGISISNRQKQVAIDIRKIRRAAKKILDALGCERHELSVVLVDDEEITRLNRQYFHRNRPTNVISFPMGAGVPAAIHPRILGDVVISAETARRQAAAVDGGAEEEILFLLIHGILHLVGHDHEGSPAERQKMEAKERELFSLVMGSSVGATGGSPLHLSKADLR
jgi:probable rRNA maturation factor